MFIPYVDAGDAESLLPATACDAIPHGQLDASASPSIRDTGRIGLLQQDCLFWAVAPILSLPFHQQRANGTGRAKLLQTTLLALVAIS